MGPNGTRFGYNGTLGFLRTYGGETANKIALATANGQEGV